MLRLPTHSDTGNRKGNKQEGKGEKAQEKVLGSSSKGRPTQDRAEQTGESQGKYSDCTLFSEKGFLRKQYAQSACTISTG